MPKTGHLNNPFTGPPQPARTRSCNYSSTLQRDARRLASTDPIEQVSSSAHSFGRILGIQRLDSVTRRAGADRHRQHPVTSGYGKRAWGSSSHADRGRRRPRESQYSSSGLEARELSHLVAWLTIPRPMSRDKSRRRLMVSGARSRRTCGPSLSQK